MVEKFCGGVVPAAQRVELDAADLGDLRAYAAAMDGSRGYLLHEGLRAVWRTVARANEFVQGSQPWSLAKDASRRAELEAVLAGAARALARQAVALTPFMPAKMTELWA